MQWSRLRTVAGGSDTKPWVARHKVLTTVVAVMALLFGIGSVGDLGPTTRTATVKDGETARVGDKAVPSRSPSPRAPATAAQQKDSATPSASSSATAVRRPAARSAVALLASLPVKGRAPRTGYDRAAYASGWTDTDRNGCDTRNDMLRRDLVSRQVKPGTGGCVALSGWLAPDRYTGQRIHFVRGGGSEVDVDHVVALSDAWQKGSFRWASRKRVAFANDPLNLLAVSASANRSKGDGDAATWLPPNKSYRCAYVARQVAVKAKYELWVTAAERDAIARVLARCPAQTVPRGTAPTLSPVGGNTRTGSSSTTRAGQPVESSVPSTPTGASARCRDGTLSYSANRRGTCSHHGGVAEWLN